MRGMLELVFREECKLSSLAIFSFKVGEYGEPRDLNEMT